MRAQAGAFWGFPRPGGEVVWFLRGGPAAEDRGAAARRDPIVVHMVVRVLALSGLAATLHMQLTSGQEVHGCQPGDPKGYFTGTATSQQSGALEVSLNLRCAEGRYNGELVTPLGTFAVTGGRANSDRKSTRLNSSH